VLGTSTSGDGVFLLLLACVVVYVLDKVLHLPGMGLLHLNHYRRVGEARNVCFVQRQMLSTSMRPVVFLLLLRYPRSVPSQALHSSVERKKERPTPVSRRALRGHSVNEDHRTQQRKEARSPAPGSSQPACAPRSRRADPLRLLM
jgi:hypothetical protein